MAHNRTWDLGNGVVVTFTIPDKLTRKNIDRLKRYIDVLSQEYAIAWDEDELVAPPVQQPPVVQQAAALEAAPVPFVETPSTAPGPAETVAAAYPPSSTTAPKPAKPATTKAAKPTRPCVQCSGPMPADKKSNAEVCSKVCKNARKIDRAKAIVTAQLAAGLKPMSQSELVLDMLMRLGPLPLARIAPEMGLGITGAAGLCSKLVGMGIIHRLPDGLYSAQPAGQVLGTHDASRPSPRAPLILAETTKRHAPPAGRTDPFADLASRITTDVLAPQPAALTQEEIDRQMAEANGHLKVRGARPPGGSPCILVGGCRAINDNLVGKLLNYGIEVVQKVLPDSAHVSWAKDARAIVLLTDYVDHRLSDNAVAEARRRGVPCVRAMHKWSRLRQALDEQWLNRAAAVA